MVLWVETKPSPNISSVWFKILTMEKHQGRRELLEVISQQKEQLARYETRLKDVVRAYKGLAKEKETLETSLKAITAAVNEEKEEEDQQARTDTECETDTESIAESVASDVTSSAAEIKPKAKLAALSSSLAAVTAEKAQTEAKFLADKRKMRKEVEDLRAQLEKYEKTESELKVSLEENKSKLIIERHEREKEMNNNKLMIQEMQKLVADERYGKENLSSEIAELKSKLIILEDPSKNRESESKIIRLKDELESAKMKLIVKEKQIEDKNMTEQKIGNLREEINQLKQKHYEQLKLAEAARENAELRALEIQSHQEKRVVNLESRLQELSQSVCSYEKLRVDDQSVILSMQEELETLHHENSALVRATSTEPTAEESEEKVNVGRIIEKVVSFKSFLLESDACDVDTLKDIFIMPGQEDLLAKVRQLEEKIAKHERERSKTSPGKFEEFLSNSSQQEKMKSIKSLNEDLKTKVSLLKQKNFDLENNLKDKHLELLELKQEHEKEKDRLRKDAKKQLTSLRLDFQEHRERSLTLLQEKDEEIHKLRNQIELALEENFYSPERLDRERSIEKSVSPLQALPRKISVETMELSSLHQEGTSGPPLHYLQEISRKDVEIKELRNQQYQAETCLRELQLNISVKEEKYQVSHFIYLHRGIEHLTFQDKIEELEDNVRRLERMTTVEGASQEYLKNVVLNYMLSTDIGSKNHMLKAIGAVLKLTPKEIKRVIEHNHAWWWNQNKLSTSTPGHKA